MGTTGGEHDMDNYWDSHYQCRPVPDSQMLWADSLGHIWWNGRLLKPRIDHKGYPRVLRDVPVHTLVCTTFHGPCPPGLECRHHNDIKIDCSAGNLLWGTRGENLSDAWRNGRRSSKLTADDVRAMRRDYATGCRNQGDLAAMYGVASQHVSDIINHKYWKHVKEVH